MESTEVRQTTELIFLFVTPNCDSLETKFQAFIKYYAWMILTRELGVPMQQREISRAQEQDFSTRI